MAIFGKLGEFLETAAPYVAPLVPGLGAAAPVVQALSGAELARRAQKSAVAGSQAVTTPTPEQAPVAAPESALSSMYATYQPTYTAGLPAPRIPTRPSPAITTGMDLMDFVPDISISKYFGGSAVCAVRPSQAPVTVKADGCITVSRKQQQQLRRGIELLGMNAVADSIGLSVEELAALMLKRFPPRRKGITGAQLKNAKRVNRTIMSMAKELQDACKTTTTRRRK